MIARSMCRISCLRKYPDTDDGSREGRTVVSFMSEACLPRNLHFLDYHAWDFECLFCSVNIHVFCLGAHHISAPKQSNT